MKNIQRFYIINIVVLVITILLFVFGEQLSKYIQNNISTPLPPEHTAIPMITTSTPILSFIYQAITKEDLSCYITTISGQIRVTVVIPEYGIVEVVGKNNNDKWILIRYEGLPECWVELRLLNLNGDVSSLPVITTSVPPILASSSTPEFGTSTLDVDISMTIVECACDGKSGNVIVTLNIKNGEPPYDVSGLGLLTGNKITFPLDMGSRASLIVTSSDGKKWEGIVIAPIQCTPLPNSCINAGEPKPLCSDGEDNDNDGYIDYPADPGCDSPDDTHE